MQRLLEYLNAERGRRKVLAAALHVHPSAISQWTRVPAERLGEVARATNIPPEQLRPDMFTAAAPEERAA